MSLIYIFSHFERIQSIFDFPITDTINRHSLFLSCSTRSISIFVSIQRKSRSFHFCFWFSSLFTPLRCDSTVVDSHFYSSLSRNCSNAVEKYEQFSWFHPSVHHAISLCIVAIYQSTQLFLSFFSLSLLLLKMIVPYFFLHFCAQLFAFF